MHCVGGGADHHGVGAAAADGHRAAAGCARRHPPGQLGFVRKTRRRLARMRRLRSVQIDMTSGHCRNVGAQTLGVTGHCSAVCAGDDWAHA